MSAIIGIGIDIEEIGRFESLTEEWGPRFQKKIYTDAEINYCAGKTRPPQHFAARFAAKEAFSKAIGTGWRNNFRWTDVEIRNDGAGKPSFFLHGTIGEEFGHYGIHLSLSHSNTYVAAMVVIQDRKT